MCTLKDKLMYLIAKRLLSERSLSIGISLYFLFCITTTLMFPPTGVELQRRSNYTSLNYKKCIARDGCLKKIYHPRRDGACAHQTCCTCSSHHTRPVWCVQALPPLNIFIYHVGQYPLVSMRAGAAGAPHRGPWGSKGPMNIEVQLKMNLSIII